MRSSGKWVMSHLIAIHQSLIDVALDVAHSQHIELFSPLFSLLQSVTDLCVCDNIAIKHAPSECQLHQGWASAHNALFAGRYPPSPELPNTRHCHCQLSALLLCFPFRIFLHIFALPLSSSYPLFSFLNGCPTLHV